MTDLPHGMTYAALGGVTLTMAALLVWGIVRNIIRRSGVEGDIDTRLPTIIDASVKPWQQLADMQKGIIDEERKEKLRAQDEREAITKQFIEYSTQQDNLHRADLDKIRTESLASAQRVHDRLDECNSRDATNAERLKEALRRLDSLEIHERAAFSAARASQAVPLAPIAPVAPIAPAASFSIPAGGLNITPASP